MKLTGFGLVPLFGLLYTPTGHFSLLTNLGIPTTFSFGFLEGFTVFTPPSPDGLWY